MSASRAPARNSAPHSENLSIAANWAGLKTGNTPRLAWLLALRWVDHCKAMWSYSVYLRLNKQRGFLLGGVSKAKGVTPFIDRDLTIGLTRLLVGKPDVNLGWHLFLQQTNRTPHQTDAPNRVNSTPFGYPLFTIV